MSAVLETNSYPATMNHKLRRICHRQLVLIIIRSLLLALATLLGAMLAALLIDWSLTLLSTSVRLLITTIVLGVTIATLFVTAVRPICKSLGLRRAAIDVDRVMPQLEERWTTVADFVESKSVKRVQSPIEKAMLRQVTSEAVAMERLVSPAKVATLHQLRQAGMYCLGAMIAVAIFLAANWQLHTVLLRRFWSPLQHITATQLDSVTGDLIVPRGDPVELVVNMSGFPRKSAKIELLSEEVGAETAILRPEEETPGQFRYRIAALESSFRYRVTAGDGLTTWHSVKAVDRPILAEVKVTLRAPDYVRRPAYQKDYLPTHLQAVQGSHLRLEMRPSVELKRLELKRKRANSSATGSDSVSSETEALLLLTADRNGWYRYETILEEDVAIVASLLSSYDLGNDNPYKCTIRVVPDRPPVARVISPTDEIAVTPDESVEVKFEAHDDHGIVKAELVVYEESKVAGEPPMIRSVEEIPLGDQLGDPHIKATAKLDLSKYDLENGSTISYAIRVSDNRISMKDQNSNPSANAGMNLDTKLPELASGESSNSSEGMKKSDLTESSAKSRDSSEGKSDAELLATAKAIVKGDRQAGSETNSSTKRPGEEPVPPANEQKVAASQPGNATADELANRKEPLSDESTRAKSDLKENGDAVAAEHKAERGELAKSSKEKGAPDKAAVAKADQSEEKASEDMDGKSVSSDRKDEPSPDETEGSSKSKTDVAAQSGESQVQARSDFEPQTSDAESPARAVVQKESSMPADDRSLVSGNGKPVDFRPDVRDDALPEFTESNRLRLRIEEKLVSAAESSGAGEKLTFRIREKLQQIDAELKVAEDVAAPLVASVSLSGIADPQIRDLKSIDERLATVDAIIAKLRKETTETPYAFVGLQMVEVGTTNITPARDSVFALIRQPDVDAHQNMTEALHRIRRARELLAEILVRYERVLREQRLASAIEETAKIYEVYVKNLHRFLRAQTKPTPNPLQRSMAIVEVDQAYLDRLREVTEMRRDLMAEFARMLGDDPRLLSKYMDLIQRRQTSLRDRLTELRERQEGIATEVSGWLRVDESQRADVWMLAAEVRLQDLAPLVQEASQLEERTVSQFPLALDRQITASAKVIEASKQLALSASAAAQKSRRLLRDPSNDRIDLKGDIEGLVFWLAEYDAALDQLAFEHASDEVSNFSDKRLAESRTLLERIVGWTEMAACLKLQRFSGLAKVDQQQLGLRTELLRIDLEGIDEQFATEFRGEVPETVQGMANELKQLMEAITFNQAAATFELQADRLNLAEIQQGLAVENFKRAEELFDRIRRTVIEELDKVDPQDPNIADLNDPTLDELLEQLEREPDLNALLGLPDRPQNLRVISDFLTSLDGNVPVPMALEQAAEQARRRAQEDEKAPPRMRRNAGEDDDQEQDEWQQVADAEEAQQKLQEKIDELKRRAEDPKTESEEAEKLRQMAEQLAAMQRNLSGRQIDKKEWEEMVRSDQMRAVLRAAARGEPLPDSQWTRLMSTLDDGLWQVRRRTPPEEFRQAIEQYQEQIRKLTNSEVTDDR